MPERTGRRNPKSRAWLVPVLLGVVVAGIVGAVIATKTTATTTTQRDTLADQVSQACAQGGTGADQLRAVGACQQAQQIQSTPVAIEPPAPTQAEIDTAVTAYLQAHPPAGVAPTADEVTAAVASYLQANPVAGLPPTQAQIADAVAAYLTANPPAAGPAPSQEQIDAAAARYLADHPPAPGAPVAGWVFTDGTGTRQTCSRDSGSPDTAPTYTCRAASDGGGGGEGGGPGGPPDTGQPQNPPPDTGQPNTTPVTPDDGPGI